MRNSFNDLKNQLSEQDIDQIIEIIGHRCRVKTCNRLRSILTYSPSLIPTYGILERLTKKKTAAGLTARANLILMRLKLYAKSLRKEIKMKKLQALRSFARSFKSLARKEV